MLIHEALRLRLIADATVGGLVGVRIYPGALSQAVTYPAAAYKLITREHVQRIDHRGHSGLCRYRFRFFSTCDQDTANGFDTAKALDEAIRMCLQGFHGTITDSTVSPAESVVVNGIFQRSSFDDYDDKSKTFQVISDYDVWAVERRPE